MAADILVECGHNPYDVVSQPRGARLLASLIERVTAGPQSVFRAKQLGGERWREFYGYSQESIRLDNLFDATVYVAHAAGTNSKAKYKTIAPRPGDAPKHIEPKRRVLSFDLDDENWGSDFAGLL